MNALECYDCGKPATHTIVPPGTHLTTGDVQLQESDLRCDRCAFDLARDGEEMSRIEVVR